VHAIQRQPTRPEPPPHDAPRLFYRRGRRFPRAIAWFGARSFWGHLWHLAASVIATEDIDSRDWMRADPPDEFTRRVAGALGAGARQGESLTEILERDVWIDFIADTGDCSSVSAAVARMLFDKFEVADPEDPDQRIELPRGDVLVFGGDTAYPVATELEIHNRVIVPFNRVLREMLDAKPRVLLGVPGNHDWFAGLDGFHRMFHERRGRVARQSSLPRDETDTAGQVGHFVHWIEAFTVGRFVAKRPCLPIDGYVPVQTASYWALKIAPALSLWGVDRQLRSVDFIQRLFFAEAQRGGGHVLCLADPVQAFLEPNAPGVEVLEALDLSVQEDGVLVLTGDTHHYCREQMGSGTHVTAGGGGAFLHPARILRRGLPEPAAEFPGPRTSLALVLQVPWQIVHGRSGFLVHMFVALLYAPTFGVLASGGSAGVGHAVTISVVVAICAFLIGGWRGPKKWGVLGLSVATGAAFGALPVVVDRVMALVLGSGGALSRTARVLVEYGVSVYFGTLLLGTYLMLLTLFGLEQHQAFGALAHPGYKHFVRLRVRRDGTAVDAWVLGKVDPLSKRDPVVLVDSFTWKNPRPQ
jgi:hypothetical protein